MTLTHHAVVLRLRKLLYPAASFDHGVIFGRLSRGKLKGSRRQRGAFVRSGYVICAFVALLGKGTGGWWKIEEAVLPCAFAAVVEGIILGGNKAAAEVYRHGAAP